MHDKVLQSVCPMPGGCNCSGQLRVINRTHFQAYMLCLMHSINALIKLDIILHFINDDVMLRWAINLKRKESNTELNM